MCQKKRTGYPPKLYDCFGEKLTLQEAAERVFVTESTLRYRLKRCGGDMEAAMSYYSNTMAQSQQDTDAMVDTLVSAIMGEDADSDDGMPSGAITGGDEPTELSDAWAAGQPAPDTVQPADDPRLVPLRRYNRAIDAMTDLMMTCGELPDEIAEHLLRCCSALQAERAIRFDPLVPWNIIAERGGDLR